MINPSILPLAAVAAVMAYQVTTEAIILAMHLHIHYTSKIPNRPSGTLLEVWEFYYKNTYPALSFLGIRMKPPLKFGRANAPKRK